MLEIRGLETSYGDSQVLFGMDISIGAGEVVTLLGRNGMGKTTTVHTILGILRPQSGRIMFEGVGIQGLPSYKVAQAGIGLVPEGRQIFPNLSVRENLIATARARQGEGENWTFDKVLDLFPALAPRLESAGNQLSGGELPGEVLQLRGVRPHRGRVSVFRHGPEVLQLPRARPHLGTHARVFRSLF